MPSLGGMLISESLFLLLRRDDGKAESAMAYTAYGLAAAAITDLVLAERVTLSDDKDPRLSVLDASPTGHPVLDGALARLGERDGKRISSLVTDGKVAPEERVAESLVAAGTITVEEKRMLGLVPAKYPVRDPEPERALRERLRAVLHGGTPQPAESTLLAILQGLDMLPKVLDEEKGELSKKDLKARVEEVSRDVATAPAVASAVQAMNTAIMTAVIIPAVTTTTIIS